MRQMLSFLALITLVSAVPTRLGAQAAKHTYIGVKACGMCHKGAAKGDQLGSWEKSKHAAAYAVLTTPAANEIAKASQFTTPAAETPACLGCHAVTGDAKADVKSGVQCESCHGPGSDYKSMATMKERQKAVAAGMKEYKDKAAIEAQCRTCHNEKSPTFKGFKFDEEWARIQHPRPKSP